MIPPLRTYLHANSYSLLFLLIICASYCAVLTPYYLNIPRDDDFPSLYAFARQYANGGGIQSIIALYSDHRIALVRMVSLLSIWTVGSLDLQWMGYVGIWLFMPAIGWLFIRFFRRANLPAIYLTPAFLCLFQPQYYESVAKVDILYTLIISALLTGLAIYTALFASTYIGKVLGAAVFCTVATFTFGSGLFSWLIVGLVWLLDQRWWRALGWYAAAVLIFWLYMQGHHRAGYMHEITLPFIQKNYKYLLQGWLSFLGAAVSKDMQVSVWNVILGTFVVCIFGLVAFRTIQTRSKTDDASLVERGFLIWLACTLFIGLVTTLGRVYGPDGIWTIMLGRYKFYTALSIALTYCLLLFVLPRHRKLVAGLAGFLTLVFFSWSYRVYLPELNARYNSHVASIINWRRTGTGLLYWNQAEGDSILREAIRTKDYIYPTNLKLNHFAAPPLAQSATKPVDSSLEIDRQTVIRSFGAYAFPEDIITFRNKAVSARPHLGNGLYVVLRNPQFTYLLATEPQPYLGRNPFGRGSGYTVTMRSTLYRPGVYSVFELHVDDSDFQFHQTGQHVEVRDIPQTTSQLPPVR